jgi:hypothetical protein
MVHCRLHLVQFRDAFISPSMRPPPSLATGVVVPCRCRTPTTGLGAGRGAGEPRRLSIAWPPALPGARIPIAGATRQRDGASRSLSLLPLPTHMPQHSLVTHQNPKFSFLPYTSPFCHCTASLNAHLRESSLANSHSSLRSQIPPQWVTRMPFTLPSSPSRLSATRVGGRFLRALDAADALTRSLLYRDGRQHEDRRL